MFKKMISILFSCFLLCFVNACSSGKSKSDNLDLEEVREIEASGEFNEEEFFSDGDVLDELEVTETGDSDDLQIDAGIDLETDLALNTDGETQEFNFDEFETEDGMKLNLEEEFNFTTEDEQINQKVVTVDPDGIPDGTISEFEESEEDFIASLGDSDEDMGITSSVTEIESPKISIPDVAVNTPVPPTVIKSYSNSTPAKISSYSNSSAPRVEKSYSGPVQVRSSSTKTLVPVKKIAEQPYNKNGVLVNGVYIVRADDTVQSITEKIYGSSSDFDIYRVNSNLRKGLKVGDKVYYNSPKRPQDDSRLVFYYEDINQRAQEYVASGPVNIREISEDLLGHSRSWMEIWATNPDVSSKWEIPDGTRLKYYSGASSGSLASNTRQRPRATTTSQPPKQAVARNIAPSNPPPTRPQTVASNTTQRPPVNSGSASKISPPPTVDPSQIAATGAAVGQVAANTSADAEALARDAARKQQEARQEMLRKRLEAQKQTRDRINSQNQAAAKKKLPQQKQAKAKGGLFGMDPTLILGSVGGILVLLLLLLVIRKKKKSKKPTNIQEFDFGGTETVINEGTKTHIDL